MLGMLSEVLWCRVQASPGAFVDGELEAKGERDPSDGGSHSERQGGPAPVARGVPREVDMRSHDFLIASVVALTSALPATDTG